MAGVALIGIALLTPGAARAQDRGGSADIPAPAPRIRNPPDVPARSATSRASVIPRHPRAAANLRRTIDPGSVWSQLPMGKDGTARWYRAMCERFRAVGFDAPIVDELARAVDELSLRASA